VRKPLALALVAATTLVLIGCTQGETEPATNITSVSAKLNAKGSCEQGDFGQWWFQYRPGTRGTWTARPRHRYGPPGTSFECPNPNVQVSDVVTGLQRDTDYQFRICATDPPGWGNRVPDCADSDGNLTNDPPNWDSFTTNRRSPRE
jgi:hypothetical protein